MRGTATSFHGGCYCLKVSPRDQKACGHATVPGAGTGRGHALGSAAVTTAGNLPFAAIIRGWIDMLWRASEESIRRCARSAIEIVNREGFASVAFPIIGAGSGGMNEAKARAFRR